MNILRKVAAAAFGFGLSVAATQAMAQGDEPDKFAGLYAGLVSGYGIADDDFSQTGGAFDGPISLDLEGGLAGITAGYNWRIDNLLFGVEGDATTLGLGDSASCDDGAATCVVDMDAMVTLRARLGFIFGDESQYAVYGTGGLANVWWDASSTSNPPGANITSADLGFAVGGGFAAYLMDTNWMSTKIEYLYVNIDVDRTFNISGGSTRVGRLRLEDIHLLRWGWNIHF